MHRFFPLRPFIVLSAFLLITGLFTGCGGPATSPDPDLRAKIGKFCTVQFRRGDGLGSGAPLPVGPTTSGINGAEVSLSGKLASVGTSWVSIQQTEKKSFHIPRESILLIEFSE